MKAKKKAPHQRGAREKRITTRCAVCDEAFETTRDDATTCSARCRKARSRWMAGKVVSIILERGTADENLPCVQKPHRKPTGQK